MPPADLNTARPVALITGASSGIGKALADNFAAAGYDVILSARSIEKMQAHAADLQQRFGITAHVIAADLESPAGAAELHAEVKRRGLTLSALVNNAGYGTYGEFKDVSLDSQLGMMQLNMTSLVALAKLFLPDLIATRGKMLNTASTAAFQPAPTWPSTTPPRRSSSASPKRSPPSSLYSLALWKRAGLLGTRRGEVRVHRSP